MNVKTASERMAEPIGHDLAHADSQVQAEFLNAFAQEAWMAWGSSINGRDHQSCSIVRELTPKGRWLVKELAAFIALDEEEPS